MLYLDTSAAMKLVVAEHGSTALRRWLRPRVEQLVSSDLLRTELLRAVRRATPGRVLRAREVLDSLLLARVSTTICERAATLEPSGLRSLDALHLACALDLGDELEAIVTYDERLSGAARANGIEVIAPS